MRPRGWRGRLLPECPADAQTTAHSGRSVIAVVLHGMSLVQSRDVLCASKTCSRFIHSFYAFRGYFICLLILFRHFLEQNKHFIFEIDFSVRDFDVRDNFINIH